MAYLTDQWSLMVMYLPSCMLNIVCLHRLQDLEPSCQQTTQLMAPAAGATCTVDSEAASKEPSGWSQQHQAVVDDLPIDTSHAASPSVQPVAIPAGVNGLSRPASMLEVLAASYALLQSAVASAAQAAAEVRGRDVL